MEQNDAQTRLQFINQQLAREVELAAPEIQSQVQGQLLRRNSANFICASSESDPEELGEGEDREQETNFARIEKAGCRTK